MSAQAITLSGTVYASVFNPDDARKNWQDMVSAFCYAFKDKADACLVLKFVSMDTDDAERELKNLLYKSSPFDCRVIATAKHLSSDDYASLIEASSYYVNTSHGEGQCIPMMEFLSCGKPGIAPHDSSMLDYHDAEVGFIIDSSKEITHWQHDARRHYRCLQTRINWMSLVEAYQESYRVFNEDKESYSQMSAKAIARMEQHCSNATIKNKMEKFLSRISAD